MFKAALIGNLGRDPEQRYSQQGTMVVSFSVAINDRQRQPDGSYTEHTEWVKAICFGKLAEVANERLRKGSRVYLDGRLQVSRWEKEGVPQQGLELVVSELQNLTPRPEGQAPEMQPRKPQEAVKRPNDPAWNGADELDLPF